MNKIGYKGKGLGKAEDGIIEPIASKIVDLKGNEAGAQNKVCSLLILYDSILNQLDEKRLSKKGDVKVFIKGVAQLSAGIRIFLMRCD